MGGGWTDALGKLARGFERGKRVLPWRDQPTLYRVWISEIMLQQTQVATVVPYFERFLHRFPDVQTLAAASVDEVLLAWAGLGYYSRARNLHSAARRIREAGDFPDSREGWLALPGVGAYTAGAILSIALDRPEAILDGNVERVLARVRRVSRARGDAAYKRRLWRLSGIFVRRAFLLGIRPGVLNQALMELGATVCVPRGPVCPLCPLSGICRARQGGEVDAYPPRKKAPARVEIREEVHCVLDREGRMLLEKRPAGKWRAGLWDFPESGPPVPLHSAARVGRVESRHVVTRHEITRVTHVWRVREMRLSASERRVDWPGERRWVPASLPGVAVGSALRKALQRIRETFPEVLPGPSSPGAGSSD